MLTESFSLEEFTWFWSPTVFIWKNYHIMNLSLPEDLLNYRHVRDNFPVHHLYYAVISTHISIATLRRIHLLNDFHSIFITIIWIYLIKLRTNCDISISFSYYEKNISFVPFKYNKHALCVYIFFPPRVYPSYHSIINVRSFYHCWFHRKKKKNKKKSTYIFLIT